MPTNNNQKVYIDIPLDIQLTPLNLFQKFVPFNYPEDPLDLGLQLLTKIDNAIRSPDAQIQLINFLSLDLRQKLQDQAKYEERDFSAKVQTVYDQLRLRNTFRLSKGGDIKKFIQISQQSWQVYQSIFERQNKQINFPPMVAWQILQNFLYQFSQYHQVRLQSADCSQFQPQIFSIERSKKLVQVLYSGIPTDKSKVLTSKDYFAYFSLIIAATLQVYSGNYKESLKILSRISLTDLNVYSKSIGSLLNLFLTSIYAYFMESKYKQSARLAEMVLMFFQKNKKYFSGVCGEYVTTRLFQKITGLLCLNYVFLQQKPKNSIIQIFKNTQIKLKDKQNKQKIYDKYSKLKQNDQSTFIKLFTFSSIPSTYIKQEQIQSVVLARFQSLQKVTLHTILQHYTRIPLQKISKMINISQEQVMKQIQSFNNVSTGNAQWDRTIMQPLLSQTRKIYVQVVEGIAQLDTDQTNANQGDNEWQQYRKQISWLKQKVNAL